MSGVENEETEKYGRLIVGVENMGKISEITVASLEDGKENDQHKSSRYQTAACLQHFDWKINKINKHQTTYN